MAKRTRKTKSPAGVNINLLVALEALMDTLNVTQAATLINKSQPALSSSLNQLRHLFNDPILERKSGIMRLSPRARQLQPRVKMAMEAVRSVLANIEDFVPAGSKIKVRLCSTDHATFRLLPALKERLKERDVDADLVIQWPRSKNDALKRLKEGDYDVVFGAFLETRPNITRFRLYEERLVCLMRAGHPMAKLVASVDDLKPFPVVNTAYTGTAGRQVILALQGYGFDVKLIESTANFILIPFFLLGEDTIAFTTEREATWLASIMPLTTSKLSFALPTFPVEMIVDSARVNEGWLRWLIGQIIELASESPFRTFDNHLVQADFSQGRTARTPINTN